TIFKFAAGILGNSAAMVADAVHSLSDFATDIVAVVSFRVVKKPVDLNHNYGHGKAETIASLIIGISLGAVGVGIVWSGLHRIVDFLAGESLTRPGFISLTAALISVLSKEWLYRYTILKAKKLESETLVAKAWDHRSDALSSVGTLLGIGGAIFLGPRWTLLDPLAAVVVGLIILKVCIPITLGSLNELMESSAGLELQQTIVDNIVSLSDVRGINCIKTRRIGGDLAVDVKVILSPELNLVEAHNISTTIEKRLKTLHRGHVFVNVHPEPYGYADRDEIDRVLLADWELNDTAGTQGEIKTVETPLLCV
ncbi:MAG TPA: cation diffusion facilitator family transporter, partial [Synergistales bacterium]|nr:cation diffusion facilitator family transporter [Synergistales bacterium]